MNAPSIVNERKRLEEVLALAVALETSHKNIIACNHTIASKLIDNSLQSVGKVSRHVQALKRDLAKMNVEKGSEHGTTPKS